MYFAVGTLALARAVQTIVGNIFSRTVSMLGNFLTTYSPTVRYYMGLMLVVISMVVVDYVIRSKVGLVMLAIRTMSRLLRLPA